MPPCCRARDTALRAIFSHAAADIDIIADSADYYTLIDYYHYTLQAPLRHERCRLFQALAAAKMLRR